MKKLTQATSESHDVSIYDGGVRYYYEFPDGMTVGEIATDFLHGYDGTGEIQFEMTFSADDETVYAKGFPNVEAEICDPTSDEASLWTA
jgi:hypothetical protein